MPRTPATRFTPPPMSTESVDLFCPRSYQKKLIAAFSIDPATKRPRTKHGVAVWPRRTGKDSTAFFGVALPAMTFIQGNYWHILPKYTQARKAIFHEEASFLSRIPKKWRAKPMATEQFWQLWVPGTDLMCRYYLLGADDTDTVSKLVGSNPMGVIYSEAAQMDIQAVRALIRPALAENGGWELLVSTPRGKNEFYRLYQRALTDPEWYCELLTMEQCRKDAKALDGSSLPSEDGRMVIGLEEMEADRRSGIPEEKIQQENYCSWEGYEVGTIYGDLLQRARSEGRIGPVPHDPRKPVGVMMDIGRTDLTAMWFYQVEGSAIRFIDYHAARGMDSTSCIRFLKENKLYHYGRIVLPHDAKERRFQAARYENVAREFQVWFRCPVVVAGKVDKQLQINAVRRMFPRFYFDEAKCGKEFEPSVPSGLDSIGNFRRPWNDEKKEYGVQPVHDKFCHGADGLAVGMVAWQEGLESPAEQHRQSYATSQFDPFADVQEVHDAPRWDGEIPLHRDRAWQTEVGLQGQ